MVLTLKILLKDVRPQVWRRVRVPGAFTLAELHFRFAGGHGMGERASRGSDATDAPVRCNGDMGSAFSP
jgi:hypothetical protein